MKEHKDACCKGFIYQQVYGGGARVGETASHQVKGDNSTGPREKAQEAPAKKRRCTSEHYSRGPTERRGGRKCSGWQEGIMCMQDSEVGNGGSEDEELVGVQTPAKVQLLSTGNYMSAHSTCAMLVPDITSRIQRRQDTIT